MTAGADADGVDREPPGPRPGGAASEAAAAVPAGRDEAGSPAPGGPPPGALARACEVAARSPLGVTGLLLVGTHLVFGTQLLRRGAVFAAGPGDALAYLAGGAAALALLALALQQAWPARRAPAAALGALLVVGHAVLCGVRHRLRVGLDWAVVVEHAGVLLQPGSLGVALADFTRTDALLLAGLVAGLAALEVRGRALSRPGWRARRRGLAGLGLGAAWLALALEAPGLAQDEGSALLRDALAYHGGPGASGGPDDPARALPPGTPLVRRLAPSGGRAAPPADGAAPRPHVFLLFLESWSGLHVGRDGPGGPVTPNLDRAAARGLWVERAYGASIHTTRGLYATLASVPPPYAGRLTTRFARARQRTLAHVLAERGWDPVYGQAYENLDFDDYGAFLPRLGFAEVVCMDARLAAPGDAALAGAWGLRDDVAFARFFAFLERRRADALAAGRGEPRFFATFLTASHHMPFEVDPRDLPSGWPAPASAEERFVASMRVADGHLARFFAELEARAWLADSLVVVVADHAFPSGQHGSHHNAVGAWEEHLRIPLLFLWPGRLAPGRTPPDVACSQLDVAPTVLDLLGLEAEAPWLGRSLVAPGAFAPGGEQPAVPAVQPYGGVSLVAVRFPWKRVDHLRSGRRQLFDLGRDPDERAPLPLEAAPPSDRAALEQALERVRLVQRLLEVDRLAPAPTGPPTPAGPRGG